MGLQPQRLQSLAVDAPAGLQAALRAQDKHNTDIAQALNSALVMGSSLQVLSPYTSSAPLVVPADSVALTIGAGWTVSASIAYRQSPSGWVELFGTVTGGSLSTDMVTGMPAPSANRVFVVNANNAFGKAVLLSAGPSLQLTVGSTTAVDLYNIVYLANNSPPYVPSCFPFDSLWPNPTPPTLVLAQCLDANSKSPSNLSLFLPDWVLINQGGKSIIRVRNIPGLRPNTSYSVTLVCL